MIFLDLFITVTLAQQTYLKASNAGIVDEFGRSTALSGDTLVVGAPYEDSGATGVDGNQFDNFTFEAGAAYVFVRTGTTWSQQAYLKASNTGPGSLFGWSVSISGDTIVVGAPLEGTSPSQAGAAYVFVRTGSSWSQQAYLKASNPDADDWFGTSVSISGDTIVVGATQEDSQASGVDGDESDNGAADSGAAYVFVRSGTVWSQQGYLKASNTMANDHFGSAVSTSGDSVVVSAPHEDAGATDSGAAYVFVRGGSTWAQQGYLKASNAGADDEFGGSVSLSADTLVVGAPNEDDGGADSGAAYVFARSGTTWAQQDYLKASNVDAGDSFGSFVTIDGERLVVGADLEDSHAVGVNGNESDDGYSGAGAAYLFERNGTTWIQEAYLKASNPGVEDRFGTSVSMAGGLVIVGAPQEDSSATGANGDQTLNNASGAGAVYVFDLAAVFSPHCYPGMADVIACPCGQPANPAGGCKNFGATSTSGAVLGGSGVPSLAADTMVLTTSNHRTAPVGGILNVFFTGQGASSVGVASNAGVRCVNTNLKRLYTGNTSAEALSKPGMGDASVSARSAALGVGITAGQTRHYYNVYRDTAATNPGACGNSAANTNLTNAGAITWGP